MAGPSQHLSKLSEFFGEVLNVERGNLSDEEFTNHVNSQWPQLDAEGEGNHIGHAMKDMLHEDLRNVQQQEYNSELGLLDLYIRAYKKAKMHGKMSSTEVARTECFVNPMQLIANAASANMDSDPLLNEFREHFHGAGCKEWGLDRFYPEFLEPFTHNMVLAEKMFNVLDTDQSGKINFGELETACKWVLRQFAKDSSETINTVQALWHAVVEHWIVPELLYDEVCTAPITKDDVEATQPTAQEREQAAPVQVLVRSSAEKFIKMHDKNVLLLFYDPQCPHCIYVKEQFKTVASQLVADSRTDVVVGQMDVTANSIPSSLEVSEVPTVYFKPASGFAFRYRGLRSASALLDLVKSKSAL